MDKANTIKLWIHKAAKEEDVTNLFVSFERCGELELSRTPLETWLFVCRKNLFRPYYKLLPIFILY
jgi:hypothetical protein